MEAKTMTASLKITYWAESRGDARSVYDFDGIEDFRGTLDENYISVVQGRPGPLGGLYELAVEFVSNLTLVEVAKFLLAGIAFDLIKAGTKSFILRPFLSAYEKLKVRNPIRRLDIEVFRIVFQDTMLVIYKIAEGSIFEKLEEIMKTVALCSDHLTLNTGERPFEIHIPVFEDLANDRPCRFRVKLDVDETIENITSENYFQFWGLHYDYMGDRVFNVEKGLIVENEFYKQDRYWKEMEERWRRERETGRA
jgi:hypothetical protein